MARKRIGELLLERGYITQAQLEEGLAHQRQTRQRLGVALVQKGFIAESQLAKALSEATGFREVDLNTLQPEWAAIHTLRATFCEANDLFPYGMETAPDGKKRLLVAMSDPLNLPALEEIEFTTGLKVSARIAPLTAVRAAILRYYHRKGPDGQPVPPPAPAAPEKAAAPPPPQEDEEIIEGEVLDDEPTGRTKLANLMKAREERERSRRSKRPQTVTESLSEDLDYLLGMRDQSDPVEELERKFWALMRLMAKKGLLTNEEFARELEGDDKD